jgi:hypothetical protein
MLEPCRLGQAERPKRGVGCFVGKKGSATTAGLSLFVVLVVLSLLIDRRGVPDRRAEMGGGVEVLGVCSKVHER